jgi:chromosome segregation ATPase
MSSNNWIIDKWIWSSFCFTALQKSEKERENLKVEIRKLKDELQDSKEQITAVNSEERKLHKIIQDADEEREKQTKEMEQVNGKHIFSAQCPH